MNSVVLGLRSLWRGEGNMQMKYFNLKYASTTLPIGLYYPHTKLHHYRPTIELWIFAFVVITNQNKYANFYELFNMCTDLVMTDHMGDTHIPNTTHIPSFVTVAHIEEYLPAANQNKLANQNKHANEL